MVVDASGGWRILDKAAGVTTDHAVRDPQVVLGQRGLGARTDGGQEDRASYAALSNTIVGLVLLGAGASFAALAAMSVSVVIGLFAAMCFAAAIIAKGLDEVQDA